MGYSSVTWVISGTSVTCYIWYMGYMDLLIRSRALVVRHTILIFCIILILTSNWRGWLRDTQSQPYKFIDIRMTSQEQIPIRLRQCPRYGRSGTELVAVIRKCDLKRLQHFVSQFARRLLKKHA